MSVSEKRGLGRGLSALIGDTIPQQDVSGAVAAPMRPDRTIPIERISANPDQPRRDFDENDLRELAESIKQKGILQPLLVRPVGDRYQIVAGERRWRAAQIAQLHEVPALIREYSDDEVLEIAIIENIQRADLNAVEEARGYRQLMDRFGHTQEKLAEALSKSRSHIANQLRLLNLPEPILDMLRRSQISAGHARAMLTAQNPMEIARAVIDGGLSVRDTEALVRNGLPAKKQGKAPGSSGKDADTVALENDLSATLGMRVSIDHSAGNDGGKMTISYRNLDELDMLCQALSQIERLAH